LTRSSFLLAFVCTAASAGDFLPMTPIGADVLPVTVSVEGDRDFARPAEEQLRDDIDFSGLLACADDGVASISAEIEESSGRLTMTAEIVAGGDVVLSREYSGDDTDLYPMVHALADDAVFALTGERGIASTRIGFVMRSGTNYALAARGFDPRGITSLLRDTVVITTPAWSPDGSRIAFTAFRQDNGDLYLLETSTGRARRILARQGLNATPCWTPDGVSIAVMLTEGGNADIYLLDVASGTTTRLTTRTAIDTSPSISPTGQQMVFTSDRSGAPQLYVMDMTGAGAERMSFAHSYCDSPAWSPRGDMIAYAARASGGIHIFVMRSDGTDIRQVTFEGSLNEDPVWGPTGRHLAFSSNRQGTRSIYVLELNSLQVKRFTDSGECYCPTWSPLPATGGAD
jgi:TolB protein